MPNARKYERVCEWCDERFMAAKPAARYCCDNHRKTASMHRLTSACPQCGGKMGVQARFRGDNLCRDCYLKAEAQRVAERDRQLVAWWADGLTLVEIADRLGWSRGHLQQEMHRARERGAHLPYRYRLSNPQFAELAA